VYSFINFSGLTYGFALALLTTTYVRNEIRYDRFHEKIDRLHRFRYAVSNGMQLASTPDEAKFMGEQINAQLF
jgi:putative ABC transport system permease protein